MSTQNSKEKSESQLGFIGCYTQPVPHEPTAKGEGILTIRATAHGIEKVHTNPVDTVGRNPSFITLSRGKDDQQELIAVNEVPEEANGTITQMKVCENGILSKMGIAICGRAPAHVTDVKNGVVVSCFGDGSIWSYSRNVDGLLKACSVIYPYNTFLSRNKDLRQGDTMIESGLHMTLLLPIMDLNGLHELMIVCDPKADMVTLVHRHKTKATLQIMHYLRTIKDGYPRHAISYIRFQYENVVYIALAKQRAIMQTIVTDFSIETEQIYQLPAAANGNVGVLGAIKRHENWILVSERGRDADGIWRIEILENGDLGIGNAEWRKCGPIPRDFEISKYCLVVAHQESGDIGVIDLKRMKEREWEECEVKREVVGNEYTAPVCVIFDE